MHRLSVRELFDPSESVHGARIGRFLYKTVRCTVVFGRLSVHRRSKASITSLNNKDNNINIKQHAAESQPRLSPGELTSTTAAACEWPRDRQYCRCCDRAAVYPPADYAPLLPSLSDRHLNTVLSSNIAALVATATNGDY